MLDMRALRKLFTLLRLHVTMRWSSWHALRHRRAANKWRARFEQDDRLLQRIAGAK